jgi:hypothetical protein
LNHYGAANVPFSTDDDFAEYEEYDSATPHVSGTYNGDDPGENDGYANREKDIMFYSYLNQVASVRSDIFTAYVLVRAYNSTDFSADGVGGDGQYVPLDEYRFLVVFDRSGLTAERPTPRVIAVAQPQD